MVTEKIKHNAADIQAELEWFHRILKVRSRLNAKENTEYEDVYDVAPPDLKDSPSEYAKFITERQFGFNERFLMILAAVPHIRPELLDLFMVRNQQTQQAYTEFGGRNGKHHSGFLPTGETAMFILAGRDLPKRFAIQQAFHTDHLFYKEKILRLEDVEKGEPMLSGTLSISKEVLDLITFGEYRKPAFAVDFPAKLLTTKMDWDDLVLPVHVIRQLKEIETWILKKKILMVNWGMEKYLKPGYKTLFYGPPGTGKTLTATLLGKKTGRDVYRIDLSQTVSKYIGETEKNLANVFDRAENKEWILFFDEADALFGNRTGTRDAHDRYANQQVSYLLQRIEDHNGLVILASNLKNNIDNAFLRRFQSIIHFPIPDSEERQKLWEVGFGNSVQLREDVDLKSVSREYEIAGGTIVNVIQHCLLHALEKDSREVCPDDILDGIKREFHKNRRTI